MRFRTLLWIILVSVWISGALPMGAQQGGEIQAGKEAGEDADPKTKDLQQQKLQAELDKLEKEKLKLEEETLELKTSNAAVGAITRRATAWGGIVGSIFGTLITVMIFAIGNRLNKNQREQAREKHLLEIFRDLGNEESPRIRMGAVAVLAQRIRQNRRMIAGSRFKKSSNRLPEADEIPTMVSALIVASKHEKEVVIQKQIADSLAEALDAIMPSGQSPTTAKSPLQRYDFQGVQFENAWWRWIDARGVDFYKACLRRAGLRASFFSGAVLKLADLSGSTLSEAQLDEADLQGAILKKAKLKKTNLRKANLTNVDLTAADLSGADLRGADLRGARLDRETKVDSETNLEEANLSTAILIGNVDLSAAKKDASTKLPVTPTPVVQAPPLAPVPAPEPPPFQD